MASNKVKQSNVLAVVDSDVAADAVVLRGPVEKAILDYADFAMLKSALKRDFVHMSSDEANARYASIELVMDSKSATFKTAEPSPDDQRVFFHDQTYSAWVAEGRTNLVGYKVSIYDYRTVSTDIGLFKVENRMAEVRTDFFVFTNGIASYVFGKNGKQYVSAEKLLRHMGGDVIVNELVGLVVRFARRAAANANKGIIVSMDGRKGVHDGKLTPYGKFLRAKNQRDASMKEAGF